MFENRNEKRTEIICQNLFTGRIVQNVVEIILFVFSPTITSKYAYKLSEKTLFLSVFDLLGLRDPHFSAHFQEIRYFNVFARTVGFFVIRFGIIRSRINRIRSAALVRRRHLVQNF